MSHRILTINPGSTSTKIGVFEDETLLFDETIRHSPEELAAFGSIPGQKDFRKQLVLDALKKRDFDLSTLSATSGRSGALKVLYSGGTYRLSDELVYHAISGFQGQHASNLGTPIAREIGDELGIPSFTVDPPVVDELMPIAQYSGHPMFKRKSIFHTLNQKAVARRYAREVGKRYEDLNLIVCHLGGGISISAHVKGRVLDAGNALDGEGPFSPDRAGNLPVGQVLDVCFSGEYTKSEVRSMVVGHGGLMAYTGTNDVRELMQRAADGDEKVQEVLDAFHYRLAKEVGTMSVIFKGKVDQIILTGGIAYNEATVKAITEWVDWIAPVTVYPGEDELLALAQGALRVLRGEEEAKEY